MYCFTFTSIAIKSVSLVVQVGLGAVATMVGGTVGTVVIINANQPHEETQIVASNPNDDKSPSEQKDTQIGEAGESKDDNKTEQTPNDDKSATNNSQATTQKPNNSSASNNQSNNASFSKPSTPATQPSAPSQPSQPTQPTKKPDYNLNDKYVVGSRTYAFNIYDQNTGECKLAEEKSFFGIAKFQGQYSDLWTGSHYSQYVAYAKSKGYDLDHCGGMGSAPMSWQDAISQGIALDETKCAQYGLSCRRW